MKSVYFFFFALALSFFIGCGGGPQLLDHEPTNDELRVSLGEAFDDVFKNDVMRQQTIARLDGPKIPWSEMGKGERERHMARSVMPVMLTLFQSFDKGEEVRFRSFSCLTCHGETFTGGRVGEFDFARPTHLYPLDPNNLPTVENPGKSTARMVQFMKYTVTPAMRILLGRKDVNCFTCHQSK